MLLLYSFSPAARYPGPGSLESISLCLFVLCILFLNRFSNCFHIIVLSLFNAYIYKCRSANDIGKRRWLKCFNVKSKWVGYSRSSQFMLHKVAVIAICWGTLFTWKKFTSYISAITDRLCCINWAFFNRLSEYKPLWDSYPFSASPAWIPLNSTEANDYNPVRHANRPSSHNALQTYHTRYSLLAREDAIIACEPSNLILTISFPSMKRRTLDTSWTLSRRALPGSCSFAVCVFAVDW